MVVYSCTPYSERRPGFLRIYICGWRLAFNIRPFIISAQRCHLTRLPPRFFRED